MKFIATTSDKLDQIPVKQGQLIFSRDDRVVYLDSDKRTSFQQIITLVDEEQRKNLIGPMQGFYFIGSTGAFWSYDDQCGWKIVRLASESEILYELPEQGVEKKIYIQGTKMYKWDNEAKKYLELGKDPLWETL